MRILITGATGFVGRYLTRHLNDAWPDAEIHGTSIHTEEAKAVQLHQIDLRQPEHVTALLDDVQPDTIFHLAAQSSPRLSLADPWGTIENNVRAQLNIFEASLSLSTKPKILIVGSADIYETSDDPIDEDTPFNPANPYAVSKITQDMLALQYYQTHQLQIIRARPFNHTGPGQSEAFVAPAFALQIARIETGQQPPILEVGNLGAKRDFTDVRDVVRAYRLLVEKGEPGEVYNIASGETYSIQQLLDTLVGFSKVAIEVRVDPARFLPVDVPVKQGNADRLAQATGWRPTIPLEQTLYDLLAECRQRVGGTS